MRILITGGFGFIGGCIASHLASLGHTIFLGTRSQTSAPPWLPSALPVHCDWDNLISLESICKNVDLIIHSAGMNASDCLANPGSALAFNGLATSQLVFAATKVGVPRFIFLSTAHVYSERLEGVINEHSCPRNLHPYATSNLAGEHSVLFASSRGGIDGVIFRMSNIFGKPINKEVNCWHLLINDLCRQAVVSQSLNLRSNGVQQRDFLPMSQFCLMMENFVNSWPVYNQHRVFNVGYGQSHTVLSVARLVQQRCFHLYGYYPMVNLPTNSPDSVGETLKYDTLHSPLLSTPISIQSEIDNLLEYCSSFFLQT